MDDRLGTGPAPFRTYVAAVTSMFYQGNMGEKQLATQAVAPGYAGMALSGATPFKRRPRVPLVPTAACPWRPSRLARDNAFTRTESIEHALRQSGLARPTPLPRNLRESGPGSRTANSALRTRHCELGLTRSAAGEDRRLLSHSSTSERGHQTRLPSAELSMPGPGEHDSACALPESQKKLHTASNASTDSRCVGSARSALQAPRPGVQ